MSPMRPFVSQGLDDHCWCFIIFSSRSEVRSEVRKGALEEDDEVMMEMVMN